MAQCPLNVVNLFSLFCHYLRLEKHAALYLKKLESPLPSNALCQVWWKLAQWFFKFLQCIFVISLWLPLRERSLQHSIWTNLSPGHPKMLGAKLGWHWNSVSGEEVKIVKSLLIQRQMKDDRWFQNPLEFSAQVN